MTSLTTATVRFADAAMLPCQTCRPRDNVAIALHSLPSGTKIVATASEICGEEISHDAAQIEIVLRQPILEGHRFVVSSSIAAGDELTSWGLPFGRAVRELQRGEYIMNDLMRVALKGRSEYFSCGKFMTEDAIPTQDTELSVFVSSCDSVNFVDPDTSSNNKFSLDLDAIEERDYNAARCRDAWQSETFEGFMRSTCEYRLTHGISLRRRGIGTRNFVLVLSLTSLAAPTVRALPQTCADYLTTCATSKNFDGFCFAPHTEGESPVQNNITLLLRCLCGWLLHPNVGSAVVLYTGEEQHITKETLIDYLKEHCGEYADTVPSSQGEPHIQWFRVGNNSSNESSELLTVFATAVTQAQSTRRVPCPKSGIKIALQCGGSDAFSGVSGNCLAGAIAEQMMLNFGSSANIAESPELVGAEPYMLDNIATKSTASSFIATTERYKEFASRHGQNASGNPSGGNLFRGLYNIVLKSLGAARKKSPTIALDGVLDYAIPIGDSHCKYVFMDSPGNDLESIAGQVATGCNIIIFITGNGAITNFPFVPTLKVVTTSKRFKMLSKDMDIDAGRWMETPSTEKQDVTLAQWQSKVVDEGVNLVVATCEGSRSKGELSGHSQVSIWRNWFKTEASTADLDIPSSSIETSCHPIEVLPYPPEVDYNKNECCLSDHIGGDQSTGLILPTSICSSEVANKIAQRLDKERFSGLRWISLRHTEGCAAAGGAVYEKNFQHLTLGHVLHPRVAKAVFVEHGCEKTHNDYFRNTFDNFGVGDLIPRFGFFGVQKDGGNDGVENSVESFLRTTSTPTSIVPSQRVPRVSLLVAGKGDVGEVASQIVKFVSNVLHGVVIVPRSSPLLSNKRWCSDCLVEGSVSSTGHWEDAAPTLPFAFPILLQETSRTTQHGVHIMDVDQSMNFVETMTGCGAASDLLVIVSTSKGTSMVAPGSVMTPTLRYHVDTCSTSLSVLFSSITSTLSGAPNSSLFSRVDYCVPRGVDGVSL